MAPFQSLLVGLALDEEGEVTRASRRAALQARWLAERTGGRVTLLHACWDDHLRNLATGGALLRGSPPPQVAHTLEREREEFAKAGIACGIEVDAENPPWLAMTRLARGGRHDLVVVARRNEPAPLHTRTGANCRSLLRKCPAPVWIVSEHGELLHRTVLAATDLSEVGARATRLAARLARTLDCELHVVHALDVPFEQRMSRGRGPARKLREVAAGLEADAHAAIAEGLERELDLCVPKVHVVQGSPKRVILDAARDLDADLLVLGTASRSGLPGLVRGNTAERLVDALDCSLLTVKPLGFGAPVEAA